MSNTLAFLSATADDMFEMLAGCVIYNTECFKWETITRVSHVCCRGLLVAFHPRFSVLLSRNSAEYYAIARFVVTRTNVLLLRAKHEQLMVSSMQALGEHGSGTPSKASNCILHTAAHVARCCTLSSAGWTSTALSTACASQ